MQVKMIIFEKGKSRTIFADGLEDLITKAKKALPNEKKIKTLEKEV